MTNVLVWLLAAVTAGELDGDAEGRRLNLPAVPFNYSSDRVPDHAREVCEATDNTPADNPITDAGATLGRVLFYDTHLSINRTTSCAMCHSPGDGFTDAMDRSVGHAGATVRRNSMPLVNLRYDPGGRFFWDGRAATLEQQVVEPIRHVDEMGLPHDEMVRRLNRDPVYRPLFGSAFGDDVATVDRVGKALAQFVRSITSFDSRYDRGLAAAGDPSAAFANFTDEENWGKQLFRQFRCAECHLPDVDHRRQSVLFQTSEFLNNGLDVDSPDVDRGRGEVTGVVTDHGRFKSSSLRNIELTGPYMHDGRFGTLDEVLEHYNWSVKPVDNLDARLMGFAENMVSMNQMEKEALEAFLRTLTDRGVLEDVRFGDPWVR